MVQKFVFPAETKVCLKGLFPVTKQTLHNIVSNKGFQQNKQTKLPQKKVCFVEFQTRSVEVCSRFKSKNKDCEKRFVCDDKTILFDEKV